MNYLPIADYAVIGDGRTAALLASDGSIDWLCLPRFDSPAIFCRLLDAEKGGFFRISPVAQHEVSRAYQGATNVLSTTFVSDAGAARLIDFMPAPAETGKVRVLRLLEGLSGEPEFEIYFKPTFDFAQEEAAIGLHADGAIARCGSHVLALASRANLRSDGNEALTGRCRVRRGERLWFALTYYDDVRETSPAVNPAGADTALERTLEYWNGWSAQCTYDGPYHELVLRSALVLKLLIHEPTGAIVAAPTTSLPEVIGGGGNWDYRYTWLRDSGLTVDALQRAGYHKESLEFFKWVENLCLRCEGGLRIMYSLDGSAELPERTLDHLDGYRGSRPVRVGNGAAAQRQLDVYGHVLEAAWLCHSRMGHSVRGELWARLREFADTVEAIWREPDQGPWEVRGEARHFLYSKVFCWVALDRAMRLAEGRAGEDENTARWRRARDEIREAILARGYCETAKAFTYFFGDPTLDASALPLPLVDFLPATDPRVTSTVDEIRKHLTSHGLVYRNLTKDLRGEGAFVLCSFALVDNLTLAGRLDEARELFERITGYANDVGLLAEEIDPASGELLGNFPQGYSHLGLIRSATRIAEAEQRKEAS